MIVITNRDTHQVKMVLPNYSEIKLYADCMFVDGKKVYNFGIDKAAIYRVENPPKDALNMFYDGRRWYGGFRLNKTTRLRS